MARSFPPTDLVKLVRAYGVLAGALDTERVIAGPLPRRWIASEVERLVPLASLPRALFETARGRELLDAEPRAGPGAPPTLVNTNRLPKLEPIVNRAILTANVLLGVRLHGDRGRGMDSIGHDLIVAAMLQDALDKPLRHGVSGAGERERVDDDHVLTWFGETVATLARDLAGAIASFEATVDGREPPPAVPSAAPHAAPSAAPSAEIATAVAAVMAGRLALTARAAGDRVLETLGPERRAELAAAGVDCTGEFPERPFLERDHRRTVAAFALDGVDRHALREPLESTLIMAVRDALDDPGKRERLSGRRGKATHEVHLNLPVMECFAVTEAPNSIETVHVAALEMVRSLERGRRKSLSTMSAHALRIAAMAERVLGHALEPIVVTLALLHDVVEDGAVGVTGYGHSLGKIQVRFGGPIAAMVSELTDSSVLTAGASKAALTLGHPHLLSPQAQYNVDRFTGMQPEPTGESEPYTLSGIVIKLLDTVVSLEEGLRDPELMSGHWRHSGARIYWAERVRGAIVGPLIERLLIELRESRTDPSYHARPHHVNAVRLRAGLALIEMTLACQDLYATQNLALLAREYGLDAREREVLMTRFDDPDVDEAGFRREVLEGLLDDARLVEALATGRLSELGHTTLYPKGARPGARRDEGAFLDYRRSALHRREIRRELGLDSPGKAGAFALRRERMLRAFDAGTARLDAAREVPA